MAKLIDWQFDAFVSYSHAFDGRLASALQQGLERLLCKWYQRRTFRIFRDRTNLAVHPDAWGAIQANLSQSRWFIFMASPSSARSYWCGEEINWWRQHSSTENIVLVVTDGEVFWDRMVGDFDWSRSTALHPSLKGIFKAEPLWLDMRWVLNESRLSSHHTRFRDALVTVAAALLGVPKDAIDDHATNALRRNRRWAAGAAFVLLLATLWSMAERYRVETERLLADARILARTQPTEALLVLSEVGNRWWADDDLLPAMSGPIWDSPLTIRRHLIGDSVQVVAWLHDGRYAAASADGVARVFSKSGMLAAEVLPRMSAASAGTTQGEPVPVDRIVVSTDKKWIAISDWEDCVRIIPTSLLTGGVRLASPACVNGEHSTYGHSSLWTAGPAGRWAAIRNGRIETSDGYMPSSGLVEVPTLTKPREIAYDGDATLYLLDEVGGVWWLRHEDLRFTKLPLQWQTDALIPCLDGRVMALPKNGLPYALRNGMATKPLPSGGKGRWRLSDSCRLALDERGDLYRVENPAEPVLRQVAPGWTETDAPVAVAFSSSDERIAVGSYEGSIRVVDVPSGKVVTLDGHQQRVFGIAFDESGLRVLSASFDQTVRIYAIDQTLATRTGPYVGATAVYASAKGGPAISTEDFYDAKDRVSGALFDVSTLHVQGTAERVSAPELVVRDWVHDGLFYLATGDDKFVMACKNPDCTDESITRKYKVDLASSGAQVQARISEDGRWIVVIDTKVLRVIGANRSSDAAVLKVDSSETISATFDARERILYTLQGNIVHQLPYGARSIALSMKGRVGYCLSAQERQASLHEWEPVARWRADRCNRTEHTETRAPT